MPETSSASRALTGVMHRVAALSRVADSAVDAALTATAAVSRSAPPPGAELAARMRVRREASKQMAAIEDTLDASTSRIGGPKSSFFASVKPDADKAEKAKCVDVAEAAVQDLHTTLLRRTLIGESPKASAGRDEATTQVEDEGRLLHLHVAHLSHAVTATTATIALSLCHLQCAPLPLPARCSTLLFEGAGAGGGAMQVVATLHMSAAAIVACCGWAALSAPAPSTAALAARDVDTFSDVGLYLDQLSEVAAKALPWSPVTPAVTAWWHFARTRDTVTFASDIRNAFGATASSESSLNGPSAFSDLLGDDGVSDAALLRAAYPDVAALESIAVLLDASAGLAPAPIIATPRTQTAAKTEAESRARDGVRRAISIATAAIRDATALRQCPQGWASGRGARALCFALLSRAECFHVLSQLDARCRSSGGGQKEEQKEEHLTTFLPPDEQRLEDIKAAVAVDGDVQVFAGMPLSMDNLLVLHRLVLDYCPSMFPPSRSDVTHATAGEAWRRRHAHASSHCSRASNLKTDQAEAAEDVVDGAAPFAALPGVPGTAAATLRSIGAAVLSVAGAASPTTAKPMSPGSCLLDLRDRAVECMASSGAAQRLTDALPSPLLTDTFARWCFPPKSQDPAGVPASMDLADGVKAVLETLCDPSKPRLLLSPSALRRLCPDPDDADASESDRLWRDGAETLAADGVTRPLATPSAAWLVRRIAVTPATDPLVAALRARASGSAAVKGKIQGAHTAFDVLLASTQKSKLSTASSVTQQSQGPSVQGKDAHSNDAPSRAQASSTSSRPPVSRAVKRPSVTTRPSTSRSSTTPTRAPHTARPRSASAAVSASPRTARKATPVSTPTHKVPTPPPTPPHATLTRRATAPLRAVPLDTSLQPQSSASSALSARASDKPTTTAATTVTAAPAGLAEFQAFDGGESATPTSSPGPKSKARPRSSPPDTRRDAQRGDGSPTRVDRDAPTVSSPLSSRRRSSVGFARSLRSQTASASAARGVSSDTTVAPSAAKAAWDNITSQRHRRPSQREGLEDGGDEGGEDACPAAPKSESNATSRSADSSTRRRSGTEHYGEAATHRLKFRDAAYVAQLLAEEEEHQQRAAQRRTHAAMSGKVSHVLSRVGTAAAVLALIAAADHATARHRAAAQRKRDEAKAAAEEKLRLQRAADEQAAAKDRAHDAQLAQTVARAKQSMEDYRAKDLARRREQARAAEQSHVSSAVPLRAGPFGMARSMSTDGRSRSFVLAPSDKDKGLRSVRERPKSASVRRPPPKPSPHAPPPLVSSPTKARAGLPMQSLGGVPGGCPKGARHARPQSAPMRRSSSSRPESQPAVPQLRPTVGPRDTAESAAAAPSASFRQALGQSDLSSPRLGSFSLGQESPPPPPAMPSAPAGHSRAGPSVTAARSAKGWYDDLLYSSDGSSDEEFIL